MVEPGMPWVYFLLLTLFWGGSFLAIQVSLGLFPPFTAAGLRILVAALLLSGVAWARGKQLKGGWPMKRKLMALGLFTLAIPWAALFWGEQYVAPAVASIINSSVPFFVTLFSWLLLSRERPRRIEQIAVGIGFLGILLVFMPALQGFSLNNMMLFGLVALLVMASSYGLGTVLVRRLGADIEPHWSFFFQALGACAALFTLSSLVESRSWMNVVTQHYPAVLALLYLSVFSTAIAWLLYFKLIHTWGAVSASSVTYSIPCVAIALDWLSQGQLPTLNQLLGATIIIGSILVMRKKPASQPPQTELSKLAA